MNMVQMRRARQRNPYSRHAAVAGMLAACTLLLCMALCNNTAGWDANSAAAC